MELFAFSKLIFLIFQVGYETINSSEDQILKQDMPPALRRVEESSILLLQASDMLRSDPYSAPARKKLIEGSRGMMWMLKMWIDDTVTWFRIYQIQGPGYNSRIS